MIRDSVAWLRRINRMIAAVVGVLLLATVAFVLGDVILRQLGSGFGGTDEISGYIMAATASWGLGFALSEMAHIRIDVVRLRLRPKGRAIFDLIAITATAGVAALIAIKAWPVLAKTLERGSRSNTPLETPLWIPQAIWFGGWLWFAMTACVLVAAAAWVLAKGDVAAATGMIGTQTEGADVVGQKDRA